MNNREKIISDTLKDLGIMPHLLGYDYLREAIGLTMDDKSVVHSIVKRMYPHIAERFDTTPIRVERAIRHAIEVAWNEPNIEVQYIIFRSTVSASRGKPTNSEFIATVADYLLLH